METAVGQAQICSVEDLNGFTISLSLSLSILLIKTISKVEPNYFTAANNGNYLL